MLFWTATLVTNALLAVDDIGVGLYLSCEQRRVARSPTQ